MDDRSSMNILNDDVPANGSDAPSPALAGDLLDCARRVKALTYGEAADLQTAAVELNELKRLTGKLRGFDPVVHLRDRPVALAFWINIYNALTIHGAIAAGVKKSVLEAKGFFRHTAYRIGPWVFSLDAIEHGLLRENRGHPARLLLPQLAPWDGRRALVVRPMDIRIHFALNCGAASCPPIRHYTAQKIDAELDLAAGSFLSGGGVRIDPATGKVHLSRLFLWFWRDFGFGKRRQLGCACGCSATCFDRQTREAIFAAARSRGMVYDAYDWTFA